MLLSITEFIGHFHPVLIHLPIGILLIAVLFQILSARQKFQSLKMAIGITLFWGMLSAIASCISGYLLSNSGDYDNQLAFNHKWLGIGTALLSILAYYFYKKEKLFLKWIMMLLGLLIIITGHLGGSLTHGSGYLINGFNNKTDSNSNAKIKPIANVQEAVLYSDVIKPILQTKCYSCHGLNKQKGKLRLDDQSFILKGGKDGVVIIAGKPDESELIKRILLPKEDDDHMPPKEKAQLSQQDIDLMHWWVSSGADFNKKVNELKQNEKIKPALLALESVSVKEENKISDIPVKTVKKADDAAIQKLKALGVVVIPVAQNSNYLSANFITAIFTDKDLQLLEPLKEQLIWLKLGNSKISDSGLNMIARLSNLTKLYLDNTSITDKGVVTLKGLSKLQYLNIINTKISAEGLMKLENLKSLQQLFVYKTAVSTAEYTNLKKIFPVTQIDTGGYKTEMLATDTMEVKPPLH